MNNRKLRYKLGVYFLSFVFVVAWVFSGFPQLRYIQFPPKVQVTKADTGTFYPNQITGDTTGEAVTELQADDSAADPDTLSAVTSSDGAHTVDRGATMYISQFDYTGIDPSATINAITLQLQYGAENGYDGTGSVQWNTGAGMSNTTITPSDISGWSTEQTYNLYAQGVDTVAELAALDIQFVNGDNGQPDAIHFDYVRLYIDYTNPVSNNAPTLSFNSATQKTDGSDIVDVSIEVDDGDDDDTRVLVELETAGFCLSGFSKITSLVEPAAGADFNDSGGAPDIENDNQYQIGSGSTTRIITSSGSNTVTFDYDISGISREGDICIRALANDDTENGSYASQTITVDTVDPTAPGNLTLSAISNDIRATFGAAGSDTNFVDYKIFYKEGTSGVTTSDTEHDDTDLDYVDYNSTSSTSITGLTCETDYVVNIWIYDSYGHSSSATEQTINSGACPNTAPQISLTQATTTADGTGIMSITTEIDDADDDDVKVYFVYNSGSCDVSLGDPTFVSASSTADYNDSGGAPSVDNSHYHQLGTTATRRVITSSGTNTVLLDWDSSVDEPSANGTYCIRGFANDDTATSTAATIEFTVDNVEPTTPGALTDGGRGYDYITLDYGSVTSDTNFEYYKIYYKAGTSGVDTDDTEHVDSDLENISYNLTPNTTVSGLSENTDYVFNIWAFDQFGNRATSTEVSLKTRARPTGTFNSAVARTDGSGIVDISIEAGSLDSRDMMAKLEYDTNSSDGSCDGPWANATLTGTATADFEDSGGPPDISTQSYQVGYTATTRISPVVWWNSSWLNRRKVTFANSGNGSLTNFPTAAILDSGNIDYGKTLSSGQDLRFVDSDNSTELEYEIEVFDEAGTSAVWVEVPTIDNSNTDYMYMYYNNTGASDNSTTTGVWDDNYVGVWHFNQDPSSSSDCAGGAGTYEICDSSNYENHGDQVGSIGAALESGAVGNAVHLDGSDDYFSIPSDTELEFSGDYTVSAWVNFDNIAGGDYPGLISRTDGASYWDFDFAWDGTDEFAMYIEPTAGYWDTQSNISGDGVWHSAGFARSGSTWNFYYNGNNVNNSYSDGTTLSTGNRTIRLGTDGPDWDPTYSLLDGLLDEVRISDIARSNGWMAAEYAAINDTYHTYASEESSTDNTNTITFDWTSQSDLPSADGTYCIRLTVNDDLYDQATPDTTTVALDNAAPTNTGIALTSGGVTATTAILNFGSQTTESNFVDYKIFYKQASSGVDPDDTEHTDTDLDYINYNGTSDTTVTGLTTGQDYTFNIWAYDSYGNRSATTTELTLKPNTAPSASSFSGTQKTDGSGTVDVSLTVNDADTDPLSVYVSYNSGTCGTGGSDPTLADLAASTGTPDLNNSAYRQIGSTSPVLTSGGANALTFDWESGTDAPTGDGTYCLVASSYDGTATSTLATTAITVDNVAPTAPGNLTVGTTTPTTVTLKLGTATIETNFQEYKVFYKVGSSGVTTGDNEFTGDGGDFDAIDYNSATDFTITGLSENTAYVANIWAYDSYGNVSSATEVSFRTETPTFRVTQYLLDNDDFTGTTFELTLDQSLKSNYFVFVQGSDGNNNGSRGPDENYMRLTSDPSGTGDLDTSTGADKLGFTRMNAVDDWEGIVTVVECLNDCTVSGFSLLDIQSVKHNADSATGTDTSGTAWSDINQVMLMGGFNGAGCTTTSTLEAYHMNTCHNRLYPSSTATINWQRYNGPIQPDATSTVMVLEWGSEWDVQRATVTGTNAGDAVDSTGEYSTTAIAEVRRDNTWVWTSGYSNSQSLAGSTEAHVITLGDGVNQSATESTVAVGSDSAPSERGFEIYVMEHLDAAVDYRFKSEGDSTALTYAQAVDSFTSTSTSMAISYNSSNGGGTAFPTNMFSARYTAKDEITLGRTYAIQAFAAWTQSINLYNVGHEASGTYEANGTFISSSIDTSDSASYPTITNGNPIQISWTQTVPSGCAVQVSVRATNTGPTPDYSTSSWQGPYSSSTATFYSQDLTGVSALQGKRFFQYRVYMETCNNYDETPSVSDVSIDFD